MIPLILQPFDIEVDEKSLRDIVNITAVAVIDAIVQEQIDIRKKQNPGLL